MSRLGELGVEKKDLQRLHTFCFYRRIVRLGAPTETSSQCIYLHGSARDGKTAVSTGSRSTPQHLPANPGEVDQRRRGATLLLGRAVETVGASDRSHLDCSALRGRLSAAGGRVARDIINHSARLIKPATEGQRRRQCKTRPKPGAMIASGYSGTTVW